MTFREILARNLLVGVGVGLVLVAHQLGPAAIMDELLVGLVAVPQMLRWAAMPSAGRIWRGDFRRAA